MIWLLLLILAFIVNLALARNGYRSRPAPAAKASSPKVTRILIVGATGGTGQELVRQALERGLTVTALVRNPARLSIQDPRLSVIPGNVLDPASVDAAVRGQEA